VEFFSETKRLEGLFVLDEYNFHNPTSTCFASLEGSLPPVPPQVGNHHDVKGQESLDLFFQQFVLTKDGYIDVQAIAAEKEANFKIAQIRSLASTIMSTRSLECGKPVIPMFPSNNSIDYTPAPIQEDQSYCFWENDLISKRALNNFEFERPLWQWALEQFRRPEVAELLSMSSRKLAFLDVGVNVGDWASPMIAAHPNLTYFGIEGSPPTAALAAANMLVSAIRRETHKMPTNGGAFLFPFPVLTWRHYERAKQDGGVCFKVESANVGGQGISSTTLQNCPAVASMAGRAYFPQLLQLIAQKQDRKVGWPSFFIAKFDIEEFEFKILSSATEWLQQKPPCYLHLEVRIDENNSHVPTRAVLELLMDAGYDVAWRALAKHHPHDPTEFPNRDQAPFWDAAKTPKVGLVQAWKVDMEGSLSWRYKDYIIGFKNEQACIDRLLDNHL
jgi:hypothetical protein